MKNTNTTTEHQEHLIPYNIFVWVWVGLIVLTFITVGASTYFPGLFGIIIAVIVTPIKALLVLEIFMHLRYESKVFRYMFYTAILIMAIFIGLTFVDYIYR